MIEKEVPDNPLLLLFLCSTRSEFEKLCDTVTLSNKDMAEVIITAKSGVSVLCHRMHNRKLLPRDMEIAKVDDLRPETLQKTMARVARIMEHPRQLIAHFFWTSGGPSWWIVVFNYAEIGNRGRQWRGGAHVHMLSHLTHPRSSPNDFLEEVLFVEKPKLPHAVHIRFERIK